MSSEDSGKGKNKEMKSKRVFDFYSHVLHLAI